MPNLELSSFMTLMPSYVEADTGLEVIAELFQKNSFRHLPVLMGSEVVGIVSMRDVALATSLAGLDESTTLLKAADICSPDPYTADIETPLDEIVAVMEERKIGATIITDKDRLVGIITTTDICRLCKQLLAEV